MSGHSLCLVNAEGAGLTVETLREALAGQIPAVRVTWFYRLNLVLVALATVLLPVVYAGIVALVVWALYQHTIYDASLIRTGGLLAYFGLTAAGVIVLFFLLKPLLARPTHRRADIEIEAGDCPLLFELIRGICGAVGAPMPSRVAVDCQVNASASFRRGFGSFLEHDLQLTVGLPLVAGLPLRQFAGVLAHEMGHFAQGSAMRLTYLVRSVNGWLARVVYERDEWDAKLFALAHGSDVRLRLILGIARGGVWVSRKVLWMLMNAGHAIGMLMMREMEYDADRYAARVAGSEVFGSTASRVRVLGICSLRATNTLAASYTERRLADDYPSLVAAVADSMPEEVRKEIEAAPPAKPKAGVFDTHPPDAARIQSAQSEHAPGIFHLEGKAAALLPDFGPLARRATEGFYRHQHGINLGWVTLVPTEEIVGRSTPAEAEERARQRYFGRLVSAGRPLSLDPKLPTSPEDIEECTRALRAARASLDRLRKPADEAAKVMDAAHQDLLAARGATLVLYAGFRADRSRMGIDVKNVAAAEPAAQDALERRVRAEADLMSARAALSQHLSAVLTLLPAAHIAGRLVDGAGLAREAETIMRTLSVMDTQAALIASMGEDGAVLKPLLELNTANAGAAQRRYTQAKPRLHALARALGQLLAALDSTPYPFEHAQGALSLADFLSKDLPPASNPFAPFWRAGHVLMSLHQVHGRALGRLAIIAEQVEGAALRDSNG